MRAIVQRLNRWILETVLGETEWTFPLNRGYGSFDEALAGEVRKVGKWRFRLFFDFNLSGKPYGYWEARDLYIRSRISFFGTAGASHFRGMLKNSDGGPVLTESYRLSNFFRLYVFLLFYMPAIIVAYGFPALIFTSVQDLQAGNISELATSFVVFPFFILGTLFFPAVGYGIGRFHVLSSRRDRDNILHILRRASA